MMMKEKLHAVQEQDHQSLTLSPPLPPRHLTCSCLLIIIIFTIFIFTTMGISSIKMVLDF